MADSADQTLNEIGQELLIAFRAEPQLANELFVRRIQDGLVDKDVVYAQGLKIQSASLLPPDNEDELLALLDRISGWCRPDQRI